MASEYKKDYVIALVMNMNDLPLFLAIEDPVNTLDFLEKPINSKETIEYHLKYDIC